MTEKKRRGKISFINLRVVSELNKCRVSEQNAVHLISAIADGLGHDLETLVINKTSIASIRKKLT